MAWSLAAAVSIGVVVLAAGLATRPSYTVLFANLSQEDAAQIVSRLGELKLEHKLQDGGRTILVVEDRVHETRLLLAGEGLPNGGGVGFEIFDEQRFGESEFAEQVKYHRALEGELARTIRHITGVDAARVHLVMPKRALFATDRGGASASVVLRLAPGLRLRGEQVRGVVHLVAASVRGLEPANVTVVDGKGAKLNSGEDIEGGKGTDSSLAYKRRVEHLKEDAVRQLLDTMLGAGKSRVRVDAVVNFAREERTEQEFDPEQTATRSFDLTTEGAVADGRTTGGVVGSASNLPGGEAPAAGKAGKGGTNRRHEIRNFEVSKVVRHTVEPVGRVTRLDVAVIVDGQWSEDGDARVFEPLEDEELRRIHGIVSSAVGAQSRRGDRVTVECVPFAASGLEPEPENQLLVLLRELEPFLPYVAAGIGIGLGFLLFLALKRRVAPLLKLPEPRGPSGPRMVELKAAPEAGGIQLPDSAKRVPLSKQLQALTGKRDAENIDEVRAYAAELANQNPDLAVRVVGGWLSEGGNA